MSALIIPAAAHALTVGDARLAAQHLSAGESHSLAVGPDGGVLAWGDNFYNQCDVPAGLDGVIAVAAGYTHSLALRADGTVVAWGGEGGTLYVPPNTNGAVAIAAGFDHSLVLSTAGTVTAAGSNNAGKCDVPSGLTDVVAVAAGYDHSLALKSDGTVVAWGSNTAGQCNVPPGLNSVVAVAAGGLHSLALRSDGTVVAWGRNTEQQCSVPTTLNNVVHISAGLLHSLALKSDGTVVAWGGVTELYTDAAVFVPSGLTNSVAVSAGGRHSLAVLQNGTFAAWGTNSSGQAFGVTSVEPLPWSTEIPVGSAFTVSFSAPVQAGSAYGQVSVKDSSGNVVAIDKSVSGNRLIIKPKSPLSSNARYTVLIPASAVKDAWGNTSIGARFEYTTPDTAPPVVTSIDPPDGARVVSVSQALSMVFNEGIVAGSKFTEIALKNAQGTAIPCTVTISGSGNRVLLVTPKSSIKGPGAYSLSVPADALQDTRGNRFAGRVTRFEIVLPTALTFSAPSSSSYASAKVSGVLKDANGKPIANKPVQIQYSSGSWKNAATVYTDASGKFAKTVNPKAKTTYRAYFAGDATYLAKASVSFTVLPKVKLTRSTSWTTLKRNKAYYAKGYVEPYHSTSDSNKVKIRAYKKGSDGKYRYVKSFKASYVYSSKTKTAYKAKVVLTSKGSWMLKAYHAKDSKNYTTYGSADYVKVK